MSGSSVYPTLERWCQIETRPGFAEQLAVFGQHVCTLCFPGQVLRFSRIIHHVEELGAELRDIALTTR